MEVASFSEIEAEFIERVYTHVWCNVATVDSLCRPRSRIMHPIWEGPVGWITTRRNSFKERHLSRNPYVSLAYIQDIFKPVYVDARVAWVEDREQKLRIWNLFKDTPPPMGFDPAVEYGSPDSETYGLLRVYPLRITLVNFPAPSIDAGQRIWRCEEE